MRRSLEFMIGLTSLVISALLIFASAYVYVMAQDSMKELWDMEAERDDMMERGEDTTEINQSIEVRRPPVEEEQSYPSACAALAWLPLIFGLYCLIWDYRERKKVESPFVPDFYHRKGEK